MHIPYFILLRRRHPRSTLFPYTTLFRSGQRGAGKDSSRDHLLARMGGRHEVVVHQASNHVISELHPLLVMRGIFDRSEEHTSELQSHHDLVCRLLLEKKKQNKINCDKYI